MAVAPSGEWLASAGADEVQIWDVSSGRLRRLEGHTADVRGVAVAPSGEWLASASFDGTVRIWEVSSGRELRRLLYQKGRFSLVKSVQQAVAVAPAGSWLVSAGEDGVRLWR